MRRGLVSPVALAGASLLGVLCCRSVPLLRRRDCPLLPVLEAGLEGHAVPVSGLQDTVGSQLLCGATRD